MPNTRRLRPVLRVGQRTSQSHEFRLVDTDGDPIDVTGADVSLTMEHDRYAYTAVEGGQATVVDGEDGVVEYEFSAAETSLHGRYRVQFEVDYGDGTELVPPDDDTWVLDVGRRIPGKHPLSVPRISADEGTFGDLQVTNIDIEQATISELVDDPDISDLSIDSLDAGELAGGIVGDRGPLTRLDGPDLYIDENGELAWSDPTDGGFTDGSDHDHSATGSGGANLRPALAVVADEFGVPVYSDVANAPQTQGRVVYATGDGATPEGIYRHDGDSYAPVNTRLEPGDDFDGAGESSFTNLQSLGAGEFSNAHFITPDDDIQARLSEIGSDSLVYLMPGVYGELGKHIYDGDNIQVYRGIELRGFGRRTVIDVPPLDNPDTPLFKTGPDVTIQDLHVKCNKNIRHGFSITSDNVTLRDLSIDDPRHHGATFIGVDDFVAENITGSGWGDDLISVSAGTTDGRVRDITGVGVQGLQTNSGSVVEIDDGSEDIQVSNVYGEDVVVVLEMHSHSGDTLPSHVQATNIQGRNLQEGGAIVRVWDGPGVVDGSVAKDIQVSNIQGFNACPNAFVMNIGNTTGESCTVKNVEVDGINGSGWTNHMVRIEIDDAGTAEDITLSNVHGSDFNAHGIFADVFTSGALTGLTIDGAALDGTGTANNEDGVRLTGEGGGTLQAELRDVYTHDWDQDGISLRSVSGCSVVGGSSRDNARDGVLLLGSTNCTVGEGIHLTGNGRDGVCERGGSPDYNLLDGIQAYGNTGDNILVNGANTVEGANQTGSP